MSAQGHALLSPSSSHRWIHCTPSARLEENEVDKGSEFAREGSTAHALCERNLRLLLAGISSMDEVSDEPNLILDAHNEYMEGEDYHSKEMEICADEYVSIVWNKYQDALSSTKDSVLYVESKLDFSEFIPGSFGTADAIIITDGTMEVIDFKYGKGVEVSAVENSQMMIYALGALREYEVMYDIKNVRMTIVQPRKYNISEYELSVDELIKWANKTLVPAAKKANLGEGEQEPGEWCRFCKIKATCAKLANQAISVYTKNEIKERIADTDMGTILGLIPAIKAWCTAVEDYATAQAIAGKEYNGYKVVEGRSLRRITSPDELGAKLLDAGYADIYKPRELKPIGELEKFVGKKEFAVLADGFIEKPKGKPTLVPNSDKREPMNYNSAVEDFKNINL